MKPRMLKDRPVVFIDTETTGLMPGVHEVIEIAAIKVLGRNRTIFYTKVRPERVYNAEPEALAVNGYAADPAPWGVAPKIAAVAPSLVDFLRGSVLVGYIVNYDVAMLNGVLTKIDPTLKLRHHNIDVMALSFEHLAPLGLTSLKLNSVRDFLGWSKDGAHRAMKDAEDTERLYNLLSRMSLTTRLGIQLRRLLHFNQ